ncbi:hypothetical protein [Streptomyces prasinus]|uniref:hypothetical protein n=1 Tax=Streptomyces prasinus TaxID=67345 RepID=UPI0033B96D57
MSREFQGAGGLRLHLDEPYSPQMADQIRKGHLVPVDDAPEPEPESTPEAPEDPGATSPADSAPAKKPNVNSRVDDWRAYAVSLGMPEDEAGEATKQELQDWVQVHEDANGGSGE